MIDQFKAGKCLHAALTDNLVLIDNMEKGRPWATPDNSDGTNPEAQAESRCQTLGVARAGWDVGAWD